MATSSTSSRRFSRTMALAIATGVTLTGGVQIVNDTHVAQAKTYDAAVSDSWVPFDSPDTPNLVAVHPPETNDHGNLVGKIYILELESNDQEVIGRKALEKAGLDLSKPVEFETSKSNIQYTYTTPSGETVTMKKGEEYDLSNVRKIKVSGQDLYDQAVLKQTFDGATRGVVINKYKGETIFPNNITSNNLVPEQPLIVNGHDGQPAVLFRGEDSSIGQPSFTPWVFNKNTMTFSSKSPNTVVTPGGGFVYTPPADAAGANVKIKITATWDQLADGYEIYDPSGPTEARPTVDMVYSVNVQQLPATLKDNGDGTFTFNSGRNGAKDVTVNTKDGVQSVTQKGNTLTFTMADGSTQSITVGSNITLKENNDGTATISDGKTTITVATANTYVKEIVNTKGKYTLKLSNGDTVSGAIDTSKNVKGIENGPDGSIVLVYNDGSKSKPIALGQTTVAQTGKGTNNHTVTITSPNGDKVTIKAANTYIDKVEKDTKGDYVLTRNDNKTFTINLQDIRNDISALKKKDSPSRAEHKAVEDKVDNLRKELNEFTNSNNDSLKELADQINALDDKVDANAKEFKDALTDISTDLQDLEFRVTRTENRLIKEVRDNHDGTFTLVTEKYGDIPGVIDTSSGVTNIISNSDGTITLEFAGKKPRTIELNQVEVSETGKGTPKHTITIKVPGEEPFRFNAFDTYVSSIETDGKGTYTLKLNNNETVTGVIDTSKTVKSIENRSDGSIVLVRTDGTKSKPIKLEQVKITESKKGTPEHTVTIEVPGGETVTLDAYDNFVTSVTKKSDGVYEITRNDGKSWKINITDLYKRVADLEAKDSPTRDEFNAVKKDIADYKKLVDNRFTKVEGDIDALRADLTAVEKRVTVLEARVDRIDNVLGDLAKCNSAKQIAAIPTALSVALYALSQMQLPGVADINTQIQQQIGVYNANAAKMWGQYGGVLQTAAATTMAAGLIGTLAYALSECQPYNRTDEMKNTPAGEMTAKADARKAERQARAEARAEARSAKQAA